MKHLKKFLLAIMLMATTLLTAQVTNQATLDSLKLKPQTESMEINYYDIQRMFDTLDVRSIFATPNYSMEGDSLLFWVMQIKLGNVGGTEDTTDELQGIADVLAVNDTIPGTSKIYSQFNFTLQSFFQLFLKAGVEVQIVADAGNVILAAPNGQIVNYNRAVFSQGFVLPDGKVVLDSNDLGGGGSGPPYDDTEVKDTLADHLTRIEALEAIDPFSKNPSDLNPEGAVAGNVMKFNGTEWAPGNDNTGGGGSAPTAGYAITVEDTIVNVDTTLVATIDRVNKTIEDSTNAIKEDLTPDAIRYSDNQINYKEFDRIKNPEGDINTGDIRLRNITETKALSTFILDDGADEYASWFKPMQDTLDFPVGLAIASDWILNGTGYLSVAQLQAAQAEGNEILSHTFDHAHLDAQDSAGYWLQLYRSKYQLDSMGLEVTGIVAPFGESNNTTQDEMSKYYKYNFRSIYPPNVKAPVNSTDIRRMSFDDRTYAECVTEIDEAVANNEWIIFAVHPQYSMYNTQPKRDTLAMLVQYLKNTVNVPIVTPREGYHQFGNTIEQGDRTAQQFFRLGGNGRLDFSGRGAQHLGYNYNPVDAGATYPADLLPTDFPDDQISITDIQLANIQGMPEWQDGRTGTLFTYHNNGEFAYQWYQLNDIGRIYYRTYDSGWEDWYQTAGGQFRQQQTVNKNYTWNNKSDSSQFRIFSGNNALLFGVDSANNSRRGYIKVGHSNPSFDLSGTLDLMPNGGSLLYNGTAVVKKTDLNNRLRIDSRSQLGTGRNVGADTTLTGMGRTLTLSTGFPSPSGHFISIADNTTYGFQIFSPIANHSHYMRSRDGGWLSWDRLWTSYDFDINDYYTQTQADSIKQFVVDSMGVELEKLRMPIVTATSGTFNASDVNKKFLNESGSSVSRTIPLDFTDMEIGDQIIIIAGASDVDIVAASGVTLDGVAASSVTVSSPSGARVLLKIGDNQYRLL